MTLTEDQAAENGYRGSIEQPEAYEAVRRVLADLPAIPKNGTAPASMGGYSFRRVEDITASLKPLFAKHGVLCLPTVTQRVETQRTTGSNKILWCVDLEIQFTFYGPKGDTLTTNVWGQGTDSGDKALQKAVTSAFKTLLSVVFCISDSEMDAEQHDVPDTARRVPAPKDRIEQCKQLILDRDLTAWIKAQGYEWPWSDEECGWIELYAKNQPGPNAVATDALTEDIITGGWCRSPGCGHSEAIHSPQCNGVKVTGVPNSSEGADVPCRCTVFVGDARDSGPAPTTSEVEPTPEPTFTRADGLAKDPAAEYDHPCEECNASYPHHEPGCLSTPF